MIKEMNFHRLSKIELTPVREYRGERDFVSRTLVLTDAHGETFEIRLYSDDPLSLKMTSEPCG